MKGVLERCVERIFLYQLVPGLKRPLGSRRITQFGRHAMNNQKHLGALRIAYWWSLSWRIEYGILQQIYRLLFATGAGMRKTIVENAHGIMGFQLLQAGVPLRQ